MGSLQGDWSEVRVLSFEDRKEEIAQKDLRLIKTQKYDGSATRGHEMKFGV